MIRFNKGRKSPGKQMNTLNLILSNSNNDLIDPNSDNLYFLA